MFFSLDDLVILEEAWGLRAATPMLWRLISRYLALRTVCPDLDSVAFVASPAYRDFELFYGCVDGNVVDVGRGPEAHRRRAELLIGDRCEADARDHLRAALAAHPDDRRLPAL